MMEDPAPAGTTSFRQLVEAGREAGRGAELATIQAGLEPELPANIQFTSGTTGSPKGATLSHHNIGKSGRCRN